MPGADISIPVTINGTYYATALTLGIAYDASMLTVNGQLEHGAIWNEITSIGGMAVSDTATAGRIGFIAIVPDGSFDTSGAVFTVSFHVSEDVEPGTVIPLVLTVEQFTYDMLDGTVVDIPFTAEDGSVIVAVPAYVTFTVTFTINGELYVTADYHYGDTVYPPQYTVPEGYTFSGWNIPETMPAHDITLDAVLQINTYTVIWLDDDGTVLEVDNNVPYGTSPEYNGAAPQKAATAQYIYTFEGWSPEPAAVTEDVTYTASYEAHLRTYTVTWYDDEGNVLEVDANVPYGTMPSYDGEVPTKPAPNQYYVYVFLGWSPGVVSVTGDASYIAAFDLVYVAPESVYISMDTVVAEPGSDVTVALNIEGTYSATALTLFVDYDSQYLSVNGQLIRQAIWNEIVAAGGTVLADVSTPGRIGFTAIIPDGSFCLSGSLFGVAFHVSEDAEPGMSILLRVRVQQFTLDELSGNVIEIPFTVSSGAVNVYIDANKVFTATFTINGEVYAAVDYHYGEAVTAPAYTVPAGHTFSGWDVPASMPAHDITVDATLTVNTYTVTWMNSDGVVLEVDENVPYGTVPSYNGATPAKASTAQYTYTFAGWSPEVVPVTGDVTYIAVFTAVTNTYTVTWMNDDGVVLEVDENVPYGTVPSYNGAMPAKASTAQYTYTFAGWSPDVVPVTGDVTYIAVYTATTNTYTVTWMNDDGTMLEMDPAVPYGTIPEYNGSMPTKAATAQYTYTFSGWSPAIVPVTGDVVYTAVFSATLNSYTVTWLNYDGTELEVDEGVFFGVTPTYNGATPIKPATPEYTYTFIGWTPEVTPVEANVTYTAVFAETARVYTITYTVNGEFYAQQSYPYGAAVTTPDYPVPDGYAFTGWEVPATMPAHDITVNAELTSIVTYCTVTFVDGVTGEVIAVVTVEYGADADAPEAPEHGWYIFTGWDSGYTNVTEDITVTSVYQLLGDVNHDGEVTAIDSLLILRYVMGLIDEDDLDLSVAEVSFDGQVTVIDALYVLRHTMGLI